jgi:hypothetical protein
MTYDSDIKTLIYAMNEKQRQDFSTLINNMKDSDLDVNLKKQHSEITCDEIIESIESITSYEKKSKQKEIASNNGETTIPIVDWGVHINHCCEKHGCKYGDIDCPVTLNLVTQKYPCEFCGDEDWDLEW